MREIGNLDYAALELLAASRQAAEQEIADKAQALHDRALEDDKSLTLIGYLGQEALGLYDDFVKRDAYFRGSGSRWHMRRYASYIQSMYGDISRPEAKDLALVEIQRLDRQKRDTRMGNSYGYAGSARIRTSYHYTSPPIMTTQPELVDAQHIGQRWRVKSNIPHTQGLIAEVMHEFMHENGMSEQTPVFRIVSAREDGTDCVITSAGEELAERDLFLPLGFITLARKAVRSNVSRRISKKW
jgi:hypothetical protein